MRFFNNNIKNKNQRQLAFATGYSAVFYGSNRATLKVNTVKCAWLVALLYMVIQVYVLYMNTYHIFSGAPPMCQICAALDNFGSAAIVNDNNVVIIAKSVNPSVLQPKAAYHSFLTYRFPRAPPP